ncbi:MAG: c-type cytochrome [Vicinamibacterales bacterium]
MKFRAVAAVVSAVWLAGAVTQMGAQQKTVWDGVYTEDQAKRGAEAYEKDCASCHQADLAGDGFAPGLAGPEFAAAWEGLSVGDLLERIRISMPPSDPNSVTTAAKADIIAHLLKMNQFPAGKTELPSDLDAAKQIQYKASKP